MTKSKLERFAQIDTFANVFQHLQTKEEVEPFHLQGKWNNGDDISYGGRGVLPVGPSNPATLETASFLVQWT